MPPDKEAPETVKQCKTCPWRVAVKPSRDVPDYDPGIYERMQSTLRSGIDAMFERVRVVMECHNGKRGAKRACAGWLHHQIGIGNNLGVRLSVMTGRLPVPKVSGPQHETFDGKEE